MSKAAVGSELELTVRAVRDAGVAVMEHFGRTPEVRFKSPSQPVTAADLAANDILHSALLGARPDYGWLSEESADTRARLSHERVWVVDPIDGTNSFVDAIPEFVVSVGLVEKGEPILAVLFNPASDELYHARRGEGAFRNGTPIAVAGPAEGRRPRLAVSRSELAEGSFTSFASRWDLVPIGSTAYRMLKVADGTVDAFFSRADKNEWDVCAAALVLEEAGGTARQIDGSPLHFNRPDPCFDGIVARGNTPLDLTRAAPDGGE